MNRPPRPLATYAADPQAFLDDLVLPSSKGEARFGDIMADFQRARFADLVPDLLAVARNEKPPIGKHWWEATKGASKDTDLAATVCWLLAFARRPIYGQAGAADTGQAGEIHKATFGLLHANPWLASRVRLIRNEIRCDATGSRLEIESADTAGSHGARPDFLVINEMHAIRKRETAENWADNADKIDWGIRVLATNAGFKNTWQWKWREIARKGGETGDWAFHKWAEPSPWTSKKKLAESKLRNSATRYNRLWRGVWASSSGDALDEADIVACVTMTGPPEPRLDWLYFGGLDLGVKHDHSAFVVLAVRPGDPTIHLVGCWSWTPAMGGGQVDLSAVRDGVRRFHEAHGLAWCGFDPSQAQLMAQDLGKSGVPMQEVPFQSTKNLNTMARELMQAFKNHCVSLYPDQLLLSDLKRLTIEDKSYGHRLTAIADATGHADRATAFAIALPAAMVAAGEGPPEETEEPDATYRVVA